MILQIVAWAYLSGLVDGLEPLDAVEFFAGGAAISRALRRAQLTCFSYDIKLQPLLHDMNSPSGWAFALSLILRTSPGGLIWFGIVCSSWVWMSRGSTGRDEINVLGSASSPAAVSGNLMVSRVMALYWVAIARGHMVVLEQPASSIMFRHPRFQELLAHVQIYKHKEHLGHFLAESPKLIALYSNDACISQVCRYRKRSWLPQSERVAKQYRDAEGNRRVVGDVNLKRTQQYPEPFGEAVAEVYIANRSRLTSRARGQPLDSGQLDLDQLWGAAADPWSDARDRKSVV